MTAAPSAIDPAPWPAAAYSRLYDPTLAVTYSAQHNSSATGITPLTLWGVTVTLDETGSPTGRMEADLTAAQAATLEVRKPWQVVEILTGYADQAQQVIFSGPIASIEERSDGTAHLVAVSSEAMLDTQPSATATYTVGSTNTTMAQVVGSLQGVWTYGNVPLRVIASGTLTAPSAYTAFRQQSMESTDSLLDFVIGCANSLGQWLRGDARGRATTGFISGSSMASYDRSRLILSDRWDSGTAINLTAITESWTRRRSTDDFAHGLSITATYKSGKTQVTKTNTYWGAYFGGDSPIIKEISIPYRPGAAFTTGGDPVAQRWADSYAARSWMVTATCRAVWWLEPGQRATVGDYTGTITKITFNIDQGTMTIELRPTVTWTPA